MLNLNMQLIQICRRNRDGSHQTQADRKCGLKLIAKQLEEMGFADMRVTSIKHKHVHILVRRWKSEGLNVGTIKNRMCYLRWWAEKVNKSGMIHENNEFYGIGKREFVARYSKAIEVDDALISLIKCPYIRSSVTLQKHFGLRREEAMKLQPKWADQGDHIRIKGSWAKGGRPRVIPIETPEQRMALDEAKALVGAGSLIPANKSYVKHLYNYEKVTHKLGIGHTHAMRHDYTHKCYEKLSGMKPPVLGGPKCNKMTAKQKCLDHKARMQISKNLGHSRKSVTGAYLGGLVSRSD